MSPTTDRLLKFIAGADPFSCALKDNLVSHIQSLNIEVEDLGNDDYYTADAKIGHIITSTDTRGLVACGTGVGISIFPNKFPDVYAATCLTPTQNSFINTPFKSPCPASKSEPWPDEIQSFLNNLISEMSKIGTNLSNSQISAHSCTICSLASGRGFSPIEIYPWGSMKINKENPTSAIVRFVNGCIEPAHHHKYGHDVVVMKGKKIVWNLSENEKYESGVGDYLFTPGGDVQRVKYLEDYI